MNKEYQEVYYSSLLLVVTANQVVVPKLAFSPEETKPRLPRPAAHSWKGCHAQPPRDAWEAAKSLGSCQDGGNAPAHLGVSPSSSNDGQQSLSKNRVCVRDRAQMSPRNRTWVINRSIPLGELVGFKVNPAKMLLAEVGPLRRQYLKCSRKIKISKTPCFSRARF